jgi:RimJ/RimL family protein N-acetyltransferase
MKVPLPIAYSCSSALIQPPWTPRSQPLIKTPLIGRHVRVDALDIERDIPLLWDALGGNDGRTINDLIQWWGLPDMTQPSDLKNLLQEIQTSPGCYVNVFRLLPNNNNNNNNNTLVVAGMASIINTQANHGTTEVGYVVHGPAMARTVAATEAHYLLANHVLGGQQQQHCCYRRYEWKCDGNNTKSRNAALRLGFTYEGTFRQHRVTARGGYNRDTAWFSMIDQEWPQRKAALEQWLDPSNFDAANGTQKKTLQEFHAMLQQQQQQQQQPQEP